MNEILVDVLALHFKATDFIGLGHYSNGTAKTKLAILLYPDSEPIQNV